MFFVCLVASNRQLIALFFERIVNYYLLLLLLFFNLHHLTKFQGEKHDNKKFQGDKGDGLSIGQSSVKTLQFLMTSTRKDWHQLPSGIITQMQKSQAVFCSMEANYPP